MPVLESRYPKEWEESQIELFDSILQPNVGELLRESSTEYNFLEIKKRLLYVIEQVKNISENYEFWAQLSDARRESIRNALNDMAIQFDSMLSFDPKQNSAWDNRNSIVANFINRYNSFYDTVIAPLSSYLGTRAYSQELNSKFGQEAKKELDEIRSVKKTIEDIQASVKDAATIAGNIASSAHGTAFNKQADEHKNSARYWMVCLIVVTLASSGIGLTVILDIARELRDKDFTANTEGYVVKVALLAFLYIGIRFVMRNYSSHEHLYIINKHRSNVLNSVEAFRTSAIGNSAKDEILLAGVGAAYAQQETGFITTKEGAGSDDGDIMGIVKSALEK